MRVGVIILNWNSDDDTLECLDSIEKYELNKDIFIVVLVDNGSYYFPSKEVFGKYTFKIHLINNRINLGFAGGNNSALEYVKESKCDYVLLLNNDTVLKEELISRLKNVLDDNPNVGVVGGINYYYDNPERVWQAGSFINYKNGKINSIDNLKYFKNQQSELDVDYVPGSCLMTRASIIKKIGLFDEHYFAYAEETDYCYRVKKLNYRVVISKNAGILHKVNKASGNLVTTYFEVRNKFYYFKNKSSKLYFLWIQVRYIIRSILKIIICHLPKREYKLAYITLLAYYDYYKKRMGKGNLELVKKIRGDC